MSLKTGQTTLPQMIDEINRVAGKADAALNSDSIVQGVGQNTNKIMSQKAVTDALAEIGAGGAGGGVYIGKTSSRLALLYNVSGSTVTAPTGHTLVAGDLIVSTVDGVVRRIKSIVGSGSSAIYVLEAFGPNTPVPTTYYKRISESSPALPSYFESEQTAVSVSMYMGDTVVIKWISMGAELQSKTKKIWVEGESLTSYGVLDIITWSTSGLPKGVSYNGNYLGNSKTWAASASEPEMIYISVPTVATLAAEALVEITVYPYCAGTYIE